MKERNRLNWRKSNSLMKVLKINERFTENTFMYMKINSINIYIGYI